MQTQNDIKEIVKQKYRDIALKDKQNDGACCGEGCCTTEVYNIMNDEYTGIEGYNDVADLGLGCGLPTQFAKIKKGDTVIDLGSGAGNDVFIARNETGPNGKVIGIDFTAEMIERARKNAADRKLNNVEFRQGDIENIPVADNTADVIVSNCVLNLVPDKDRVFREIFRVLKAGGHFSISDIVLDGVLPDEIRQAAELYAGCVTGAIQKQAYMQLIESNGFKHIAIQKDKTIVIPDEVLDRYLSPAQIDIFKAGQARITSLTVYAQK